MRSYTQRGKELTEEGKIRRKAMMENMLSELRSEKDEMIQRREVLRKQYKEMEDDNPQKTYTLMKIRKIEDDLKTEFYKIVEDREMDEPSVGKAKPPAIKGKEFEEERESKKKDEEKRKKRQEEMKKESERLEKEQDYERRIKQ